jgi:hypothetical protein
MKKLMTSAVIVAFALAAPAGAMTKGEKGAKEQCKTAYSEAKKAAGKLGTHHERVEAKRTAKTKYNECVENAKHKS